MRISIEGNIGSGKSTALARCMTNPALASVCSFFPEPLHEWGEILERYLRDRKTWALPLTLDIIRGFHASSSETTQHALVERNPLTCRYVFTEMLKNDTLLSADEMVLVDQYMSIFGWTPDAVVYIDVDPNVCLDRIKKRGRRGEVEAVTYEELRMIAHQYDKLFNTHLKNTRVVRLKQDADETMDAFNARIQKTVCDLLLDGQVKHTL